MPVNTWVEFHQPGKRHERKRRGIIKEVDGYTAVVVDELTLGVVSSNLDGRNIANLLV